MFYPRDRLDEREEQLWLAGYVLGYEDTHSYFVERGLGPPLAPPGQEGRRISSGTTQGRTPGMEG